MPARSVSTAGAGLGKDEQAASAGSGCTHLSGHLGVNDRLSFQSSLSIQMIGTKGDYSGTHPDVRSVQSTDGG
ncbi:MAG: hypothetical protein ACTIJR_15880, partial [Brevibacterium linens]